MNFCRRNNVAHHQGLHPLAKCLPETFCFCHCTLTFLLSYWVRKHQSQGTKMPPDLPGLTDQTKELVMAAINTECRFDPFCRLSEARQRDPFEQRAVIFMTMRSVLRAKYDPWRVAGFLGFKSKPFTRKYRIKIHRTSRLVLAGCHG